MIKHLLVVEPDQAIRDELRARIQRHEFEMSVLYDAASLMRRLDAEVPSAIVLRHGLPANDGIAALRRVREAGFDMPIIIVSRSAEVTDKIVAFELGANDYLVDPFDTNELLARIRNALRFHHRERFAVPAYRKQYAFGEFSLDFLGRRLFKRGVEVAVRPSVFSLLQIFSAHPMKMLTRARIMEMLGREGTYQAERGLDVLIFRVRSVLGKAPSGVQYIQTIRGQGYVFVPGDEEPATARCVDAALAVSGAARRAIHYDSAVL
ncbi:response regulator transcription factor [Trinickia caryophylli]|uniref:Two-component system, OmpR family, phosphate regulon response regulator OmpR n=1 Tax=Trinickia caryophylli TaxID=28094 RepID=A0A1X7D6W1_TRICW|nr:response regulator transcription factor [Trinickia caryophylli]WQE14923.1 response regulator transcription factor [Trinickia caryophylli]GLU31349.1 DNA-binding response regulator [Trinickia caryophylli]SMF10064.1 two-component system, OmpR family, phosphate regulon response regulator OmpR [Trinickia caryophylli]